MRGAGDYPVIHRSELAPKAGFAHVVFEGPQAAVLKDPDGYEIRVVTDVQRTGVGSVRTLRPAFEALYPK